MVVIVMLVVLAHDLEQVKVGRSIKLFVVSNEKARYKSEDDAEDPAKPKDRRAEKVDIVAKDISPL